MALDAVKRKPLKSDRVSALMSVGKTNTYQGGFTLLKVLSLKNKELSTGMNCEIYGLPEKILVEAFFLMGGGWLEGGSRRDVSRIIQKALSQEAVDGLGGTGDRR